MRIPTSATIELNNINVEIGTPMSKDTGLLPLVKEVRASSWFSTFIDELHSTLSKSHGVTHGFSNRSKLESAILSIIAGLSLGKRTPNAIAQAFAKDPLWTAVMGRSFIQRELSRLMEVLEAKGYEHLRRALLFSGSAGQEAVWADMDSSLLPLYGEQEGGAHNGHYHKFGYHAGWAVDVRTHRILAIWLNEGQEHTSKGQADQLLWMLNQGVKIDLSRFDAGIISPDMLNAMEGRVKHFVSRIKPNAVLRGLAEDVRPASPLYAGARAYGEIRYAAKSWAKEERVVVKFVAPDGPKGAAAMFPDEYFFVTNLEESPNEVVRIYLDRGESERMFGEFSSTFQPNFRHAEMRKNEVWAMLVALAHNVLSDLREKLPHEEKPKKEKIERRPAFLAEPWVFGYQRTLHAVRQTVLPLLTRVRDMALRIPCEIKKIKRRLHITARPDVLAPEWFPALMKA